MRPITALLPTAGVGIMLLTVAGCDDSSADDDGTTEAATGPYFDPNTTEDICPDLNQLTTVPQPEHFDYQPADVGMAEGDTFDCSAIIPDEEDGDFTGELPEEHVAVGFTVDVYEEPGSAQEGEDPAARIDSPLFADWYSSRLTNLSDDEHIDDACLDEACEDTIPMYGTNDEVRAFNGNLSIWISVAYISADTSIDRHDQLLTIIEEIVAATVANLELVDD